MRIIRPGQVASFSTNSWGRSYKYNGITTYFVIPFNPETEPGVPTTFIDTNGRAENDCVHSKVRLAPFVGPNEEVIYLPPVTIGNQRYTTDYDFIRYGSSFATTRYWLTWYGKRKDGHMVVNTYHHNISRATRTLSGKFTPSFNVTVYFTSSAILSVKDQGRYLYAIGKQGGSCYITFNQDETVAALYKGSSLVERLVIDDVNYHAFEADSIEDLREMVCDAAMAYEPWLRYACALREMGEGLYADNASKVDLSGREGDIDFSPRQAFLFNEPDLIFSQFRVITDPVRGYWYKWLTEHAYYDALDSAPVMNDNNLQTLAEVAKFISDLVIHKKITMPKSLNDAWLAYRYSYQTTRSDIEEAIDFVHREADLSFLDASKGTICYGMASHSVNGCDVRCRCRLRLVSNELELFDQLWVTLYKYGLAPDLYVLWDSLPYSFVVDWFIPLGDVFAVVDADNVYGGEAFDIKDVIFSLSYDSVVGSHTYHCYSRWASQPIHLNGLYWLDKPEASGKTWITRALDAAALLIRR